MRGNGSSVSLSSIEILLFNCKMWYVSTSICQIVGLEKMEGKTIGVKFWKHTKDENMEVKIFASNE